MSLDAVTAAVHAEERRHHDEIIRIISRWPEYRAHLAYALLGSAIATCDSFGIDVEDFLTQLRQREPKPPVLVPPSKRQS